MNSLNIEIKDKDVDYMFKNYELNSEPLSLSPGSQNWFKELFSHYCTAQTSSGLTLGAVPWLAIMLSTKCQHVYIIDISKKMLDNYQEIHSSKITNGARVELICNSWEKSLEEHTKKFDFIVADNSLAYIDFQEDWDNILHKISDSLLPNGIFMSRCFSTPPDFCCNSFEVVANRYYGKSNVNLTELRTRLLFSQWEPSSYCIDTTNVYSEYLKHKDLFKPIIELNARAGENDLDSIEKYRNARAIYTAPPLDKVIGAFMNQFDVISINYGPYSMATFFPLLIARKK